MSLPIDLMHEAAEFLQQKYQLNKVDQHKLALLFEAYKNPSKLQTQIRDERTAAAYVIARGLSIAGIIRTIIAAHSELFQEMKTLIDFGGGPGTFLWELLDYTHPLTYFNVDTNPYLLNVFQTLEVHFSPLFKLHMVKTVQKDYFHFKPTQHFDLGIMSYTLCENPNGAKLVDHALEFCDQLLIIEPGTPLGFQNILAARESLKRHNFNLLAPCSTQGSCPMKAVENDWCHFVQRLERTKTQMFLKGAEKNYEDEKYIYLLASRTRKPELTGNRVLAKPLQFSHRIDVLYCSDESETPQQLKVHKKSHKTLFKQVKKLKRGDLIVIPEDLKHPGVDIPE